MRLNNASKIQHEGAKCPYRHHITTGSTTCRACKFYKGTSLLKDEVFCIYPYPVKITDCVRILFYYVNSKGIHERSCPYKKDGSKCKEACIKCEYAKKIGKRYFADCIYCAYEALHKKNCVYCAYKTLHTKERRTV